MFKTGFPKLCQVVLLGAMSSKKATRLQLNLKLIPDILEFMMKSKKNVSSGFGCSFLRNLFGWGHSFFNLFKGVLLKKKGNPNLNNQSYSIKPYKLIQI